MPSFTPNHEFQLFANGEAWEHRTEFSKLDTEVAIKDAAANRTNYQPKSGALYIATDTGVRYLGDGSTWNELPYPSSDSGGTGGSAPGGETVVTSGADLQTALNNNGVVRISGRINVTDYSPITVPSYRVIFGFGMFERHNHPQVVDVIEDNSPNPTLHITGNHCKLHGFAISQSDKTGGIGIKVEGYSPNISHLDIDGGYRGIQLGDNASGTTHTEPRVMWCKIFPQGGVNSTMPGAGSTGIYVEDMHDAKIIHNIIGGYDEGIRLARSHSYLTGNHIYAYPRPDMTTGIHIGTEPTQREARWVRVVGNRVEDSVQDNGIELGDWFGDKLITNNLLEVAPGASGIERATTDSSYPNMVIRNNHIRCSSDTSTGGTALDIAPHHPNSIIDGNLVQNMASPGNATIQSNGVPAAADHMHGAIVEDSTTGNIYMRVMSGMKQIG